MKRHDQDLYGQGLFNRRIAATRHRLIAAIGIFVACIILGSVGRLTLESRPVDRSLAIFFAEAWLVDQICDTPHTLYWTDTQTGEQRPYDAHSVAADSDNLERAMVLLRQAETGAIGGGVVGIALTGIYGLWIRRLGRNAAKDQTLRGSIVVTERRLRKLASKRSEPLSLQIGSVPYPQSLEPRHLALLGTTGSGKTTALRRLLDGIEARGECALVYDTTGEFIAHYYRPERGDVILDPFDRRGAYWTPFLDLGHPAHAAQLARHMITSTGRETSDIWVDASRNLLANVLRTLKAEGRTGLPNLIQVLQSMKPDDLKRWLAGTSSARTFEEDADRATASVLFMLTKAVNTLQFLKRDAGENVEFSFREFYGNLDRMPAPRPWIFVPRKEDHLDATGPLLSCWLDCAATAVLGLPKLEARRAWFILDELPDIPRVDALERLLPQGRNFGAAAVITFQSIGQMRARYGMEEAEAMLGCVNSKLYLQLVDRETREWASRTIGDAEFETRTASDQLEPGAPRGGVSLGTSRHVRPAILEAEFRLEPRIGYLQLPDGLPVAKIKLSDAHIKRRGPPREPGFIPGELGDTLWSGGLGTPTSTKDAGIVLPESGGL